MANQRPFYAVRNPDGKIVSFHEFSDNDKLPPACLPDEAVTEEELTAAAQSLQQDSTSKVGTHRTEEVHAGAQPIQLRIDGVNKGKQPIINLVQGTDIEISAAEDAQNGHIDVTFRMLGTPQDVSALDERVRRLEIESILGEKLWNI